MKCSHSPPKRDTLLFSNVSSWHSLIPQRKLNSFQKSICRFLNSWQSVKLIIRNFWFLFCNWESSRFLLVRPTPGSSSLPLPESSPILPRTHCAFSKKNPFFLFYRTGWQIPSALVWCLLDHYFPFEIASAASKTWLFVNPTGTEGIAHRQLLLPQHRWHHRRF